MNVTYLSADAPILVVDDEFLVLWNLQEVLERMGFRSILAASSVQAGLKYLNEPQLSFAFLDVNLGSEKSFALAEALQAEGIPFAFVTGYDRSVLEGRFEDVPVLGKPVDIDALSSVISLAD